MFVRNRHALTLPEVLVVLALAIVAMLVLFPYLVGGRDSRRRERCEQWQQRISAGLLTYEKYRREFPGFVNPIGEEAKKALCSWMVSILAYAPFDRTDLWRPWERGERSVVFVPGMVCPADSRKLADAAEAERGTPPLAQLSYVVNCGRPDKPNDPACGVFFDHTLTQPTLVSLDDLQQRDGAENTLMLSENLQAGWWTDLQVADVGMVWRMTPDECSPINACADVGSRTHDLRHARPSSRHVHGVVASYCDGHQAFLSDTIDYRVVQQLMAPDDQGAGLGK
jgi:hypothetical protein